jgi:hypothetical protein
MPEVLDEKIVREENNNSRTCSWSWLIAVDLANQKLTSFVDRAAMTLTISTYLPQSESISSLY